jgi:methylenetetrahydrofolate dehydrogenase (NADP+)/methenyltetrahydrofolate cyclohydrolase
MTAQLLSGKLLAEQIERELTLIVRQKTEAGHRAPVLAVVLANDHPASQLYVQRKQEACQRIGIVSKYYDLSADCTEEKLLALINALNQDKHIDGILVQLPLPRSFNVEKIIASIDFHKDVDGFHPYHLGKLATGHPFLRPCTPYGIIRLLQNANITLEGLHAVIVGASTIVGRPLMLELLNQKCTVTICHSKTKHLNTHVREADLLISATGKHHLIETAWVKKGAIVIDVGIHHLPEGRVCGDLDFDALKEKASFITPVPGGVGPMTVAILMENTLRAGGFLT